MTDLARRTLAHRVACVMQAAALEEITRLDVRGENCGTALLDSFELAIRSIEQCVDINFRWKLMKQLAEPRRDTDEKKTGSI